MNIIFCLRRYNTSLCFILTCGFVTVQYSVLMTLLSSQQIKNGWKSRLDAVSNEFIKERIFIVINSYKTKHRLTAVQIPPDDPEEEKRYYNISGDIRNPLDKQFTLMNRNFCRDGGVDVLILVPSVPQNFHMRNASRFTYGQFSRDKMSLINNRKIEFKIRILYILGKTPDSVCSQDIRQESEKYGDIVEINFTDSYQNLTVKMLHGLKWVNEFCPRVRFVVKADEDVYINVVQLIDILQRHEELYPSIPFVLGTIHSSQEHAQVLREGKWGVSYKEMPLNFYPPYAQGNCYVISGGLVSGIVQKAQYLPYLSIEDAFITGVVAGKILGAQIVHVNRNANWLVPSVAPDACKFLRYRYVSMSNMTPEIMFEIWNILLNNTKAKCMKR